MKTSCLLRLLPITLPCFAPLATQGQVIAYDLFKIIYYNQTSAETPEAFSYRAVPRVFVSSPGDFTTGSLTRPDPLDPLSLTQYDTLWLYDESFASLSDLDAAFPDGEDYVFNLDGGTESPASLSLPLPTDGFWPDTVPAFDTASRDALLAGPDAGTDLTLSFNSFTDETDGSAERYSSLNLRIFNLADNSQVYSETGGPYTGSFTVPGGTLAGGSLYLAEIIFVNSDGFAPMGSGGPSGFASYAYVTQIEFTAVPEPGHVALAAGLALGGWAAWRRRKTAA